MSAYVPWTSDEMEDVLSNAESYLDYLTWKQRTVFKGRNGVCGSPLMTQADLAVKLGLSKSRIHQIEYEAWRKIKPIYRDEAFRKQALRHEQADAVKEQGGLA